MKGASASLGKIKKKHNIKYNNSLTLKHIPQRAIIAVLIDFGVQYIDH
jgi:hypothetical protein